jgi:hypothetical protein
MTKIQSQAEIAQQWRAEGRDFRPGEVTDEWERQGIESLRERESQILASAEQVDPADDSLQARHLREVADQIRDHRDAGHYTTQG